MEHIREENITRNETFLRSLGIERAVDSISNKKKDETEEDKKMENPSDQLTNSIETSPGQGELVGRTQEVLTLRNLLDWNSFPSSPIILVGPNGCGKDRICMAVKPSVKIWVEFLCNGFATRQDFVKALWRTLLPQIKYLFGEAGNKSKSWVWKCSRVPSTFGDFVRSLSRILQELENFSNTSETGCSIANDVKVVLYLRRLDRAALLDPHLCSNLLLLSQTVHRRIQVVATMTRLPNHFQDAHLIQFSAYSEAQLTEILRSRLLASLPAEDHSQTETCVDSLLPHLVPRLTMLTANVGYMCSLLESCWLECQNRLATSVGMHRVFTVPSSLAATVLRYVVTQPVPLCNNIRRSSSGPQFLDSRGDDGSPFANAPLSFRYLLISAYLATSNPKESDIYTFADGKRGKRRRIQESSERNDEEAPESSLHHFSLERLFSIFGQVVLSSTAFRTRLSAEKSALSLGESVGLRKERLADSVEVSRHFGDAALFAMIGDLVARGILVCSGERRLLETMSARYQCTLSGAEARVVARSINFPLQDFLFSN